MTVPELAQRMARWLAGEYEAVVFSAGDSPVGYAVFRPDLESIYLRQFFIVEDKRRHGYGRECIRILREEVWPKNVRLTVDVLCHNTAALAFWRAVGYKDYFLTLEIMPEDNG